MADRIITEIAPNELNYALNLQAKFTEELGFLPKDALRFYAAHGGVTQIHENNEPAGYLVATVAQADRPGTARIYQAAIALDLQRRHLGRALLGALVVRARARGSDRLELWCASGLEANLFWSEAGFTLTDRRPGGKKRGRMLNKWEMALQPTTDPPEPLSGSQEPLGCVRTRQLDLWDQPRRGPLEV